MKLIRCKKCEDVVRLVHTEWRQCDCKKSGGQYNDDMISATIGGECEVIGIRNDWFNGTKKDRGDKKLNLIIQGEYDGDVQIHRIESGNGPKLKMDIVKLDSETNEITFTDDRKYTINVKGNKSPKTIEVPSNKKPSFKEKKVRNENTRGLIKTLLREGLIKEDYVTPSELKRLEGELDNLFQSVGVDVEFTKHFLDRVNDERNEKDITIEELRNIFKKIYAQYKDRLVKYKDGFEAVFRNNPTDINIPFVIGWDNENNELDLINKTVMRKKNFQTSNPMLYVTGKEPKVDDTPKQERFKKYKLTSGVVVRYYADSNRFEDLGGKPIEIDDIFDSLPEEMQNMVLAKMD